VITNLHDVIMQEIWTYNVNSELSQPIQQDG